jgi:hypothetical protein
MNKDLVQPAGVPAEKRCDHPVSENYAKQNFIRTTWSEDGKAIRVQIYLHGEPDSWVLYNLPQLDGLIGLLQECRDELARKEGLGEE